MSATASKSSPLSPAQAYRPLRREAEVLAASYPTLLAEAERVASVVTQGVHGRRRPGQGETFWQYRNYQTSDSSHHIDWRRSARGDQVYVRENEWEAANTVYFWRDGSAGMDWRSGDKLPTKLTRATVLNMALAALLMRAGERCSVLGETETPRSGRVGLERISRRLAASPGAETSLSADMPSFARMVITSDFLDGAEIWRDRLAQFSARRVKGVLLHIIDPAERDFPYRGRVQMRLPGSSLLEPFMIGRAERAREAYREKFNAHCDKMKRTAQRLDWPLITHTTDQPAGLALTALYTAMAGDI